MEVILLEKIRNLGDLGEKVEVKNGYGRNFLIPEGKAVSATKKNVEDFENRRAELEKKAKKALSEAEQRAAKIKDTSIEISAQASEEGKLYGSINVNDIVEALANKDIAVEKQEVVMPEGPIHSTGEFEIDIILHSDVEAKLRLEVIPA